MVHIDHLQGRNKRHRCREQVCGHGARGVWDDLEEWDSHIYITICKTDSQWGYAI